MKKKMWQLAEQQESLGDDPIDTVPDEYQCPICYEEMSGKEHRPMIMVPCGHTICEECINSYMATQTKRLCPVCSTPMQSTAVNYALRTAIENRSSGKQIGPIDYTKELSVAKERLALLLSQMKKNEARSKLVKKELVTEQKVLAVLDEELKVMIEQHNTQKARVDELLGEDTNLDEERAKLKSVIDPLVIEVQKLELLVQGTTGK